MQQRIVIQQTIFSPLFVVCSFLFLVHQLLQLGLGIRLSFANAYLDNFLAMPVILSLLKVEHSLLFQKGPGYRLPLLTCLIATIYISVISELIFPQVSSRFTFDPFDFVFLAPACL
jgi:hypothetical protein